MIHVGIVGTGFMAAAHIKAYLKIPGVRVAALCNPSGRNLDGDFSRVTGNLDTGSPLKLDPATFKAYRSSEELFADAEISVVDLCTHTATHEALSVAALAAGKHVLCEKPLTRNSASARRIAAAAKAANSFFMPAMCLRFWPEWSWLRATIQSGVYGRVLGARFRRVAEPPGWGRQSFFNGAESGGALFDLHIHDTDFVQFCFGRPEAVFSTGCQKFSGAIDHVVTQYFVQGGAIVHAEGGWAMTPGFGFGMSYTVNFERATADYDSTRGAEPLRLSVDGVPTAVVKPDGIDGYVGELTYFLNCVRNGQRPETVTADDGASAVEICEAEERSIATRQVVSLG
jgi:predicted dehydrogenase